MEAIVDARGEQNNREFLVHWRGWPKSAQSWEPESQLIEDGCKELIQLYLEEGLAGENQWEVGALLNTRKRKGIWEFLVHWKDFPPSARTWEPAATLREDGCGDLIDKYLQDHPSRATK